MTIGEQCILEAAKEQLLKENNALNKFFNYKVLHVYLNTKLGIEDPDSTIPNLKDGFDYNTSEWSSFFDANKAISVYEARVLLYFNKEVTPEFIINQCKLNEKEDMTILIANILSDFINNGLKYNTIDDYLADHPFGEKNKEFYAFIFTSPGFLHNKCSESEYVTRILRKYCIGTRKIKVIDKPLPKPSIF